MKPFRGFPGAPVAVAAAGVVLLSLWWRHEPAVPMELRVPGTDHQPEGLSDGGGNPVARGTVQPGTGTAPDLPGSWPQFRGPARDGIAVDHTPLAREWGPGGPRRLWTTEVGEGYAGAAVEAGRVYLMDYLREGQLDALRCLSLADGQELWRFTYPIAVKRNHGMSRTVPAVASNHLVALGPKCHVICNDALTGELHWTLDLVRDYGTTVPPWYAGQCPLIDDGQVILAPGGPDALLISVDLMSGEVRWKTPNPMGWKMTHSSVTPFEFEGQRQYVYCASGGVVGVAADDGRILWQTPTWKISIAMVPSPVPVPGGRLFFSGGYNAGSLMLRLESGPDGIRPVEEFRLKATVFGATQQTPIFYRDHLFGIHPDGQLVCLTPEGQTRWSSDTVSFGLGPFLIAEGLIYAVNDSGTLTLAEASTEQFRPLASIEVLQGHEAWAPLALAANRLLMRDLTQLVCLDVGAGP